MDKYVGTHAEQFNNTNESAVAEYLKPKPVSVPTPSTQSTNKPKVKINLQAPDLNKYDGTIAE